MLSHSLCGYVTKGLRLCIGLDISDNLSFRVVYVMDERFFGSDKPVSPIQVFANYGQNYKGLIFFYYLKLKESMYQALMRKKSIATTDLDIDLDTYERNY
jgi:hypothetical protein